MPSLQAPPLPRLLNDDRRTVRSILAAYPLIDGDLRRKADIFARLRRELEIHARLEEEILYPALEAMDPELITLAREEHGLIAGVLAELAGLQPGEGSFDFLMSVLQGIVERQAALESVELFPLFAGLDAARQQSVSEAWRARKRELRT